MARTAEARVARRLATESDARVTRALCPGEIRLRSEIDHRYG